MHIDIIVFLALLLCTFFFVLESQNHKYVPRENSQIVSKQPWDRESKRERQKKEQEKERAYLKISLAAELLDELSQPLQREVANHIVLVMRTPVNI